MSVQIDNEKFDIRKTRGDHISTTFFADGQNHIFFNSVANALRLKSVNRENRIRSVLHYY